MYRNRGFRSSAFLWVVAVLLVLLCLLLLLVYRCSHFIVVSGTVGTGDYGSEIGMEFVAGIEIGYWAGKGMGESAGNEQWRVRITGKPGVGILKVAEWAEERCSADFAS